MLANPSILNVHDFFVPRFLEMHASQREYVWDETNIDQLIFDVSSSASLNLPEHFIGNVVLYLPPDGSVAQEVIDGQQRLTTFILLFAALAISLREANEQKRRAYGAHLETDLQICELLLKGLKPGEGICMRLKPLYEPSREVISKIVELELLDSTTVEDPAAQHLAEMFEHVLSQMRTLEGHRLKPFCDFLLQKTKLLVLTTTDKQEALRIFQKLNTRGRHLSPAEKVKSALLAQVPTEEFEAFSSDWKDIISMAEVANEEPSRVIRYTLNARYQQSLGEDEVLGWFDSQDNIKHFSGERLAPFFESLKDHFGAHLKFAAGKDPLKETGKIPHLEFLNGLGGKWGRIAPVRQHLLVMHVVHLFDDPLRKRVQDEVSVLIEAQYLGVLLTGKNSTQNETVFRKWATKLRELLPDDPSERLGEQGMDSAQEEFLDAILPTMRQDVSEAMVGFLEAIGEPKESRAKYLIARLSYFVERLVDPDASPEFATFIPAPKGANLEHVLPKRAKDDAKLEFGEGADDQRLIKALGNLCLLYAAPNKGKGNRPYSNKRATYKTSAWWLTRSLALSGEDVQTLIKKQREAIDRTGNYTSWDQAAIQDRTRRLVELAKDLWWDF